MSAQDAAAAADRRDLEPEVLDDEIAQRIGTERRVIVDFGDAGLVNPAAAERLGDDLAADAVARLIDRDLTGGAGLRRKVPRGEETARSATNDRDAKLAQLRRIALLDRIDLLFFTHA